jgi:hypothetical protein
MKWMKTDNCRSELGQTCVVDGSQETVPTTHANIYRCISGRSRNRRIPGRISSSFEIWGHKGNISFCLHFLRYGAMRRSSRDFAMEAFTCSGLVTGNTVHTLIFVFEILQSVFHQFTETFSLLGECLPAILLAYTCLT